MIRKFEVNTGKCIIQAFSYDHWEEYRGHTCVYYYVYYEGSKLTHGTMYCCE
jgi:hypothetical protein